MATGLNPAVRDWLALVNGIDVAFRGQIMAIKDATLDWFLIQAFGKDAASIRSQFEKPHVYLDSFFANASPPMTVALANRAMGLSAARIDASDIVSYGVKNSHASSTSRSRASRRPTTP